jgi:VWFA-related protein
MLSNFALRAQESSHVKKPLFSVDVKVVNVFVTVRDKKGNIVRDLTMEDFTLSEDGRPQTIRYFSRESDLPLTIGLIVDTTPSESNMLDVERTTSRAFLSKMLRSEKDKAFLIQYSSEVELLQDLTSSRKKLDAALNRLEPHGFEDRGGGNNGGGRGGAGPSRGPSQYATVLADAVYLASDEIMKSQEGRKALIIIGDGDHVGSREEMAITAAQEADTLIYAIRIYDKKFGGSSGGGQTMSGIPGIGGLGRGGPGGGPPGGGSDRSYKKKNLQRLSKLTGGAYFEVTKNETLEQIYGKIEEELRSQYSLGYTPGTNASNGYRKIKIDVQKKGMVVRGREGYYLKSKP